MLQVKTFIYNLKSLLLIPQTLPAESPRQGALLLG